MPLKNIFFITILFTSVSCNEINEKNSSDDKSIKKIEGCSCGDLILDELYQHFYINERTLPYTGICEDYHNNGNLYQKKKFNEGKMNGEFLEYSINNKLIKKWNFNKNKRHGNSFTYDTSGQLIFHGIYKNGILDSVILSL